MKIQKLFGDIGSLYFFKTCRKMRIGIFLLLITILQIRAEESYSQSVSLSLAFSNATVEQVLEQIEKETEFTFLFTDNTLDISKPVNIQVKNQEIGKVLNQLFKNTDVQYSIVDRQIILSKKGTPFTTQQSKRVQGTVRDEAGIPVIGANVSVKGTTIGTITDMDGHFSLDVPENSLLLISYIGYLSREIRAEAGKALTITLSEDTQSLDEVVVVGFGTQKKVNLTGSIGIANAKDLEARPVTTATQALQGLVPGLQITQRSGDLSQTADINIRGIATIGQGSSGSPLILIDGMEGDINALNPQDIENISVLKDAAASSIYGSRAPFGVILITTKTGVSGKPVINYNNSFRWNDPVLLQDQVDSYKFALYFNEARANAGQTPYFDATWLQRIKDNRDGHPSTPTMIENPSNPGYWMDPYSSGSANQDWYNTIFGHWAFSQEHNFSLNGGNDKVTYYLSLNYLDQNGLLKISDDNFGRYTATGKINVKMTDWAQLNYSSRFIREDISKPTTLDGVYEGLTRQAWPFMPTYDPNGYLYSAPTPALDLVEGGRIKKQADYLYQQAQLVLEPIKDWKTFVDVNYRIYNSTQHTDRQITYNHNVAGDPYVYNSTSYVSEDMSKENYLNFNAYTEYSKQLESGHNFKGMIGFQSELSKKKYTYLQRNGIIVPGLPETDITSGVDINGNPITPTVKGSSDHWATAGFFGRINYDYEGKYLAEVNLRYDGTSRFRSSERWNLFPSFSLGWNLARENFWEPIADHVGTFKLRGSYGELGNQNTTSLYPTYAQMQFQASNGTWLINGMRPNIAITPELIASSLTWERVKTWNIGLDFGALNNRLTGSFDYFVRNTLNMIGPAPELPITLGTNVPRTNNTDLKTYGWELSVGWNDRLQNGLGYGVRLMLSDSQTEITRYPNKTGVIASDTYRKGMKVGEIWGYTTVGIAKTQAEMDQHLASLPNGGQSALGSLWAAGDIMYADTSGDGKVDAGANTISDHGDLSIIGNSTPRYHFGIDLTADWKGIDFRAFFQGVMKRDYYQNSSTFWGSHGGIWWSTCYAPHLDYFRDENSVMVQAGEAGVNLDAYFPRPSFRTNMNHNIQTRYLQNAAYIRLKNVQLGYTLPSSLTNKFYVSKLRVFVSGENLWTGTGLFKTLDPETIDAGYGGSGYPLSKTLSFGLSVTL